MVANDCAAQSSFAAVRRSFRSAATTATHPARGGAVPGNATGSLDARSAGGRSALLHRHGHLLRAATTGRARHCAQKIGNNAAQSPHPGRGEHPVPVRGRRPTTICVVNQYLRADQVDAANDWGKIISLTIAVLVRSEDETNLERDTRTYDMLTPLSSIRPTTGGSARCSSPPSRCATRPREPPHEAFRTPPCAVRAAQSWSPACCCCWCSPSSASP